ncbi:hypothetical protein U9M48_030946 [Paspalum notatum var. saurae]|uniref:Uncharacterized protein n=1 Tax=Paspalum notatum var. saurae TaxID=547442 RepID=A0AAQ3U1L3_PASNO
MCNLSRAFKTDISAVLTVKSSLDSHRLEFKKMAYGDDNDDGDDDNGDDDDDGDDDNSDDDGYGDGSHSKYFVVFIIFQLWDGLC